MPRLKELSHGNRRENNGEAEPTLRPGERYFVTNSGRRFVEVDQDITPPPPGEGYGMYGSTVATLDLSKAEDVPTGWRVQLAERLGPSAYRFFWDGYVADATKEYLREKGVTGPISMWLDQGFDPGGLSYHFDLVNHPDSGAEVSFNGGFITINARMPEALRTQPNLGI